jgi:hypothetical protein
MPTCTSFSPQPGFRVQETAAVKAADCSGRERQAKLLDLCRKVLGPGRCKCKVGWHEQLLLTTHMDTYLQEVKYLQTIGWRRAAVLKANRVERISHTLQQATAPEQWSVHGGSKVFVITPSVARCTCVC